MTQWYQPRQVAEGSDAGKWRYTVSNSSGKSIYAVGACAEGCPGHDTAEEATRHYVEGLAAGELRERDSDSSQLKCEVCGVWTQHRAMLWRDSFSRESAICAGHDIRAHLRAKLFAQYQIEP